MPRSHMNCWPKARPISVTPPKRKSMHFATPPVLKSARRYFVRLGVMLIQRPPLMRRMWYDWKPRARVRRQLSIRFRVALLGKTKRWMTWFCCAPTERRPICWPLLLTIMTWAWPMLFVATTTLPTPRVKASYIKVWVGICRSTRISHWFMGRTVQNCRSGMERSASMLTATWDIYLRQCETTSRV